MKKFFILLIILLIFNDKVSAFNKVSVDSILTILQQKKSLRRHKQLILSIRYYFTGLSPDQLAAAKRQLQGILASRQLIDGQGIGLFVETMYLMELKQYTQ